MKVVAVIFIGLVACLGLAGGAVITGIVRIPSGATQTIVQAVPPLKPAVAQPASGADMTVTLSEPYLNRQISKGMPTGGEVSNPQIDVHGGSLADVTATVKTGFLTITPKASVQLAVLNGRVVVNILKVDVGGFGVPSSLIEPQIAQLKQNAEASINDQLAVIQTSMGLKLESLSTTENSLSLYFSQ